MTTPDPNHRRYHLTPDRFFIGLLAVQVFLLLSERFQWFAFNEQKGWTVLIGVGVVCVAVLVMLGWGIVCLCLRRRFQFSFRSLLVFFVAVSIPLGWFAWEMEKARRQRETVEAIRELGGHVLYDYQWKEMHGAKRTMLSRLRPLLGEDFCSDVVSVGAFSGEDFGNDECKRLANHLRKLPKLETLHIREAKITDDGLEKLRGLTGLRWLSLEHTNVSDEGVEELRQALPNCNILH